MAVGSRAWDLREFRALYFGQTLSAVGDGLRTIAIPLMVFSMSHSATAVGTTVAIEFLPLAVFSLLGGSLADRFDRKITLIVCDGVRAAAVLLMMIAYSTGRLALVEIYLCVAVISAASATFGTSQQTGLVHILGNERMLGGRALLNASEQGCSFVTPALGGYLYGAFGPVVTLAVDIASYVTSQISVMSIPSLGLHQSKTLPSWQQIVDDTRSGFRGLAGDRGLFAITMLDAAMNLFLMMAGAILVPYFKGPLGASNTWIGVAFGLGSLGAAMGSLAASRYFRSLPIGRLVINSSILNRLLLIPLAASGSIGVSIISLFLWNAVTAFEAVRLATWRVRVASGEDLGKVLGAISFVRIAGVVPGALLGGVVADRFGPRTAIEISIAASLLLLALSAVLVRQVRSEAR